MQIIGFVSDVHGIDAECTCTKCKQVLFGDRGYVMENGEVWCRDGEKCSLRATRNSIEEQKAAGTWAPRWRKV